MPDPVKSPPKQPVKPAAEPAAQKPEPESKAAKFKRLAEFRVPRATKAIKAVANLSVKSIYESTPDQRAKVIQAIEDAVKDLRASYAGMHATERSFTL